MNRIATFSPGGVTITDNRTLVEAKADAIEAIRDAFAARVALGTTYAGKPLQIDDASQMRLAAVVTQINAGVALPAGFAWRMADNSFLPVTGNQVIGMATAASARVMALRQAMWVAVDAVRAARDVDAVDAVKPAWPA